MPDKEGFHENYYKAPPKRYVMHDIAKIDGKLRLLL